MNGTEIKAKVVRAVEEARDQLFDVSRKIFENPEIGFQEHKAVGWLTEALERDGFRVERGIAELPTAFRATWKGKGPGPTIAILCEYDALPGIGHACSHNLMAAGGLGAGLALRRAWPDLPGQVQVIGCPAEEGGGGKVFLVDRGAFEGVDAAMMFHGADRTMSFRPSLAAQRMTFRYRGKSSHAAAGPWEGVNALDAMIQFFVGVGLLRQQLRDGYRIHGIISNGGKAANVIPDLTEAQFSIRAPSVAYQAEVKRKVIAIAEAAALATGCQVEYEEGPLYKARINNETMARLWEQNVQSLGETLGTADPNKGIGSSDVGNVSFVCPTIHPYIKIGPEGMAGHSLEFKEASGSEYGARQMLKAAQSLAMTAVDLFANPDLLAQAKAEHARALD